MLVTPLGMVVLLQPANSVFPSLDRMALHSLLLPSVDRYVTLLASTVIVVKPVQRANTLSPMLVTLPAMLTDFKPEQPLNALSPMLVTLPGMLTDVKPEQPKNA